MDAEEQTNLVFDFMQAIAPEVARFHLRILSNRAGAPYSVSEEVLAQARRETATSNANVTLEYAMHLAAAFARCQTSISETKSSETKQETPSTDKPRKAKPPERIQPAAAGVPEATSPVPDLSRIGDRSPPQARQDRSAAE